MSYFCFCSLARPSILMTSGSVEARFAPAAPVASCLGPSARPWHLDRREEGNVR